MGEFSSRGLPWKPAPALHRRRWRGGRGCAEERGVGRKTAAAVSVVVAVGGEFSLLSVLDGWRRLEGSTPACPAVTVPTRKCVIGRNGAFPSSNWYYITFVPPHETFQPPRWIRTLCLTHTHTRSRTPCTSTSAAPSPKH